ncbi:glycosyltransferase family 32 protein [Plesiomonas shigelloides]|uniref:glycosyltransferase family 32 protein n=1 Tax=Plesiomonas shigelloides TaxID=703 RepID=UPI002AFEF50A|nr:glycosyltransferase [Plesiomonas shigelloides]
MMKLCIILLNRLIRLMGNIIKGLSYPFHYLFPNIRFVIPEYSSAKIKSNSNAEIPNIIWQTNYSNHCTLPVYINYLFNRLMSLSYEYRYVSTENREDYLKKHAPKEVFDAYQKLTDGAAQADLWRVFTLYKNGGVYIDIDASLVWPLNSTLKMVKEALYIKIKGNTEITNYFLATKPDNYDFKVVLDTIISNIENYDSIQGVYGTTGPRVFNVALKDRHVDSRPRRYVCIQGAFTNEYFQYLDKPRGKWTYQKPEDLVKK